MKNILLKLGTLFTSKKGGDIIEKGMELTADNLKYKKIVKVSILVILGILLLAGTISPDAFMKLIEELL
tara:strand:- start:2634 stop:2840 length:207 start_codon:yes stop_codon:yes gene_type:complete